MKNTELTYNEFQLVAIEDIDVVENVRKRFTGKDMDELAASIKKVGLINPITITPDDKRFKIIAGERRLTACKKLGWIEIPSIIAEGDPNRLREVQLVENCQRMDMNPIEELEGFMALIAAGYEPVNIADQIGKSLPYVHTRLNLIKLNDRAKRLLFEDELNLAQCKYLVAMDEDLQEKALSSLIYTDSMDKVKFLPAKNFGEFFMKNQTYSLEEARFDETDVTLIKDIPACSKCKYNSLVNKVLFAEMAKGGFCANTSCYIKKTEATIQNKIKEWESSGVVVNECAEFYSEVYPNTYNFSKVPEDVLAQENFVVEAVVIIVEGMSDVGEHYPVYSESQLKAIKKASESSSAGQDSKTLKAAQKAIGRYAKLIVSRISENYVKENVIFTPGIHLMAIYNQFNSLNYKKSLTFLKAVNPKIVIKQDVSQPYKQAFFDNIKAIEENLESAFAIIALLHLDDEYAYKDELEFSLTTRLAKECNVDIEACRNEISTESGVDLTNI